VKHSVGNCQLLASLQHLFTFVVLLVRYSTANLQPLQYNAHCNRTKRHRAVCLCPATRIPLLDGGVCSLCRGSPEGRTGSVYDWDLSTPALALWPVLAIALPLSSAGLVAFAAQCKDDGSRAAQGCGSEGPVQSCGVEDGASRKPLHELGRSGF